MFRINFNHQSPEAIVKRSSVTQAATFSGVTKGVAVKYVSQGREQYTVGGTRILLDAGEFLLLPAGTGYSASPGVVGKATNGVCIDFLTNLPAATDLSFLYGGTFRVADLGLTHLANWDTLDETIAFAELPSLQLEIKVFLEKAVELGDVLHPVAQQLSTRRELSKSLLTARNYLQQHYAEDFCLAKLARIAGLSKYHFSRLFKRAFGVSPLRLQTTLRMEAAARLLQQKNTSITLIAHTVGYTDLPTFSRHFRAHFGVPPSKWC